MKVFWHKCIRDDFAAIRLYYDQIDPAIAHRRKALRDAEVWGESAPLAWTGA